uniref:phosphatidylinositol 3,4,5-trisphosphate 3-phosphatase TPTE2-like n=1 Tax=Macaca mulatta TaxID=9544 RepID=UPI0010A259E2|nr:phosphatidylinositol 3,4,5-trisphosphate 3-phosphatase TPTE2-like [Macaca mulatta]
MDSLTDPTVCSDSYDHNGPPTNELSGTNPEARIHESPQTNEFKGATEETLTNDIPHSSECKGAALVSPISKRRLLPQR